MFSVLLVVFILLPRLFLLSSRKAKAYNARYSKELQGEKGLDGTEREARSEKSWKGRGYVAYLELDTLKAFLLLLLRR